MITEPLVEELIPLSDNSVQLDAAGRVCMTIIGVQTGETIMALVKDGAELTKTLNYRPNVLVDVTNMGFPEMSARKAIAELLNQNLAHRQASFGISEPIKLVVNIMLRNFMNRADIKICSTKAEAIAWLDEDNPLSSRKQ